MTAPLSAIFFVVLAAICFGEALDETWQRHGSYKRVEIQNRTVHLYAGDPVCSSAGLQCTTCNRLSLCVETSTGLFEFYSEDCNAELGEYCSVSLKECTGRKSYCSLNAKFECQDEGVFPDPFDCNQYYICSSSPIGGFTAEKVVCPAGKAFNAKTSQCDLSDNDAICNGYPVPECPETGLASGPLPQNPNLYYICKGGLPHLFKCIDGDDYVYNPDLYSCVRNDSTTTTTTTTTTPKPVACAVGTVAPVPETCGRIYPCQNLPSPPELWHCGNLSDQYFNRETSKCTMGKCPYVNDWSRVCPDNTKNRPVLETCNLYYDCSFTGETSLDAIKKCDVGHFDRERGECVIRSCPYTF